MISFGGIPMANKKSIKLTAEEELELIKKYKDEGDRDALEKLVEGSQESVECIAGQFIKLSGLEMEDLISEGNIGLIKAIEKFDYTKGYRLSTFSEKYIWGEIVKYLKANNANSIKITDSDNENIEKISKFLSDYQNKHGEEPSYEEIAKAVHLKPEEVAGYLEATRDPSSLDFQTTDNTSLGDLIPDYRIPIEEYFEDKDKYDRLLKVIDECLDEREKFVITKAFDLDGSGRMKKSQIAEELGVSKQFVGEVEAKAVRKINRYIFFKNETFD
jgi:RNA polymerase primary sigma factor